MLLAVTLKESASRFVDFCDRQLTFLKSEDQRSPWWACSNELVEAATTALGAELFLPGRGGRRAPVTQDCEGGAGLRFQEKRGKRHF